MGSQSERLKTSPTLPESPTELSSTESALQKRTNEVHFVIQGKGGVGKSFVATILAEFLRERIAGLRCYDTDPVNPTFTTYSEFDVKRVELFEKGRINSKAFDSFMIEVYEAGASGLIDNGATTFILLMAYVRQSAAFETLIAAGKSVFVHIVVAGGDAQDETIDGFVQIMDNLPAGVFPVIWLNELHGTVHSNGAEFEQLTVYLKVASKIRGVIRLPAPSSELFAQDLQDMRKRRVSFQQAIESKNFNVMERQRFAMIRRDLWDRVGLVL